MPVSYNGITLDEPAEVIAHEKLPIYDSQNNYLWTRIRLTVVGTYNPATCAYTMPAGPGGNAVGPPPAHAAAPQKPNADGQGVFGPNTEKAVRHQLSQSRGTLTYTIPVGGQGGGQVTVLQSPAAGQTVDAQNGPTCHVHEVKEVWGCKTFYVAATFETCINEAYLFVGKQPSVLLSNVYAMHHSIDQDSFTTRTVRGTARFRSDLLMQLNAVPDDFRDYLFVPLPSGFWRVAVDVDADEDGTTLHYTVVDKEMPFIVTARGVSRIEAIHTAGIESAGYEKATTEVGESGPGGFAADVVGYVPFVGDILKQGVIGANAMLHPGAVAKKMVPGRSDLVVVKAWGQPACSRTTLRTVALKVLQARLFFGKSVVGATNFQITEDIAGRFVELRCSTRMGPIGSAIDLVKSVRNALTDGTGTAMQNWLNFPQEENIPGVLASQIKNFNASKPLAGGGGVKGGQTVNRGDYLGRCAVQAILGQNATPPQAYDRGVLTFLGTPQSVYQQGQ